MIDPFRNRAVAPPGTPWQPQYLPAPRFLGNFFALLTGQNILDCPGIGWYISRRLGSRSSWVRRLQVPQDPTGSCGFFLCPERIPGRLLPFGPPVLRVDGPVVIPRERRSVDRGSRKSEVVQQQQGV